MKKALKALEAKNNCTADENLKIEEYRNYLHNHSVAHDVEEGLEFLSNFVEGSQ